MWLILWNSVNKFIFLALCLSQTLTHTHTINLRPCHWSAQTASCLISDIGLCVCGGNGEGVSRHNRILDYPFICCRGHSGPVSPHLCGQLLHTTEAVTINTSGALLTLTYAEKHLLKSDNLCDFFSQSYF